ncbi:MAG: hypothetical protein ACRDPH_04000 [Marmoricola sp.]
MNLIEITHPAGTLTDDQRRSIATSIIANLLVEPDAPPEAIERAGRTTHVWFREATGWTSGGPADALDAVTPIVATITVPQAWLSDLTRHAMSAVRAALVRHLGPASLSPESTWVNVVGIPDGSIGMHGRPTTSSDLVRYLTQDVQLDTTVDLPDGVVVDPVCGMRVRLGPNAVTLRHDGTTIGFCATGCRSVYAQDHQLTVPA